MGLLAVESSPPRLPKLKLEKSRLRRQEPQQRLLQEGQGPPPWKPEVRHEQVPQAPTHHCVHSHLHPGGCIFLLCVFVINMVFKQNSKEHDLENTTNTLCIVLH